MLGSAFEAPEVGDRIILVAPDSIQPVQRIVLRFEGALPLGPLAIEAAAVLLVVCVDAFSAKAHAMN